MRGRMTLPAPPQRRFGGRAGASGRRSSASPCPSRRRPSALRCPSRRRPSASRCPSRRRSGAGAARGRRAGRPAQRRGQVRRGGGVARCARGERLAPARPGDRHAARPAALPLALSRPDQPGPVTRRHADATSGLVIGRRPRHAVGILAVPSPTRGQGLSDSVGRGGLASVEAFDGGTTRWHCDPARLVLRRTARREFRRDGRGAAGAEG